MLDEIRGYRIRTARRYVASNRHTNQVDAQAYLKELARERKRGRSLADDHSAVPSADRICAFRVTAGVPDATGSQPSSQVPIVVALVALRLAGPPHGRRRFAAERPLYRATRRGRRYDGFPTRSCRGGPVLVPLAAPSESSDADRVARATGPVQLAAGAELIQDQAMEFDPRVHPDVAMKMIAPGTSRSPRRRWQRHPACERVPAAPSPPLRRLVRSQDRISPSAQPKGRHTCGAGGLIARPGPVKRRDPGRFPYRWRW
jgi:hypothetical protein